ncbi:hypothetical protein OROGR_005487 [Orobanche gracilis]
MRSFLWAESGGNRKWHLIGWDTITKRKGEGGLGVRDMRLANSALLGKAFWQLCNNPNKLWVKVMRHKYLKRDSLFSVTSSSNSSPVWKGILKARDELKLGFKFRLGDGQSSVWYSNWSGIGKIANMVPYVHITDSNLCLRDLIHDNSWNLSSLYTSIPTNVQVLFDNVMPVIMPNGEDGWTWTSNAKGIYTVRDAYCWLVRRRVQL